MAKSKNALSIKNGRATPELTHQFNFSSVLAITDDGQESIGK
jgi:hypothetical protein